MTETTSRTISVELDSSQLAGTIAAANHINSQPADKKYSEEVMKDAARIAKEVRDEVRKRRLALGMPARSDVRSWDAPHSNGKPTGSLGVDVNQLIPPTVEELAQKRYLLAVNRIMAGKSDDPNLSLQELADIADVLGASSRGFAAMDDFVKSRTS